MRIQKLFRRQVLLNYPDDNQNIEVNTSSSDGDDQQPKLLRVMGLSSLIFLCISNSIGSGVYILTGIASNLYAGPYVALCYVLAGIACLITAFCYAEFSARVKDTSGSGYSFIYYSLGEFAGFLTGWMMFTGSVASVASTAITWSQYLDAFTNNTIKNFVIDDMHLAWNLDSPFSGYLDVSAILLTTLLFLISLWGLEMTAFFNNILACVNVILLIVIAMAGFAYGDVENLSSGNYTQGFTGVVQGSSLVFYAFLGFESSTFAINEAINPAKNIPLSLIISLAIIITTYAGASLSLNFMQPFNEINTSAPYPTAFEAIPWMKILVSIGPIISLAASFYICIYSLVRMAYAMGNDGLCFKYLAKIHPKTKVPHFATYSTLGLCLLLIITLDINNLIGFANISGFLTHSFIGIGILAVRYFHDDMKPLVDNKVTLIESACSAEELISIPMNETRMSILIKRIQERFSIYKFFQSKYIALSLIIFINFSEMLFFGLAYYIKDFSTFFTVLAIVFTVIPGILLSLFKETDRFDKISFRVPLVPLIPILVIMLNNYLLMSCEWQDWLVYLCITFFGVLIYFFYGIKHSKIRTD